MLRIVENSSPGKAPCEQSISFACLILSYSRKTLQKASHFPPLQCPSFLRMTTSRSQKSEVWSQEWNRVRSLWRMRCKFRAEKRNVHAWIFFLPRSRKNGEISNIFLPKNKMFPLIAGLPRARSARGTEPHTHGIWSTFFLLVVTWLTERTYVRTYVRVYRLYG